jgi:hypothetical protein
MNKADFYLRCAEIMDAEHELIIRSPFFRRNRWNNREAGSGRFPGIGIVRHFGDAIHIAIHHPVEFTAVYDDPEDALAALEAIFKET